MYVELLTGKRPFPGKNIRQLALQHMTEPPDLSMLPEADRPIVARALAKNPDERCPSCTAFVRSLAGPRDASGSSGSGSGGGVREPASWAKAGRTTHDVDLTPPSERGGVAVMPGPAKYKKLAPTHPEIDADHLLDRTAPQLEVGVLRPTILVGIGSFGRRALQEIRCRLTDRVGDVIQVPCFRFLYVDCDPEAAAKAVERAAGRGARDRRRVPGTAPAGHAVPPPPARTDPRLAAAREAVRDPAEPVRGRQSRASAGSRSATTTCASSRGCGARCRSPRTRSRSRNRRIRPG